MKKVVLLATLLSLALGCARVEIPKDNDNDFASYQAASGLLEVPYSMVIYGDHTGALSYRSNIGKIDKSIKSSHIRTVRSEVCQKGVFLNLGLLTGSWYTVLGVAWDQGGYKEAIDKLFTDNRGVEEVFDVKFDYNIFSVLGIFSKICLRASAKATQSIGT